MSEEFAEFITRLTDNARTSLYHADSIARGYGNRYIGTEHLMLGILAQGGSVGAKVLADAGVTLDRAEIALGLKPVIQKVHSGMNMLSETARMTLKMSWELAQEHHQDYLGTEHILHSILTQKNARATVLLRDMKAGVDEIVQDLDEYFSRQAGGSEMPEILIHTAPQPTQKRGSILDVFGDDLTERAKQGGLDPMIGRETELQRVITILSRRTKNNPVLIGEPGVGKTAIVEGLAQRIVSEDVPEHLLDKRIIQLDLAAMIAGTKYRGEFEDRLKKVMEALSEQKNCLVFIDELHMLSGAGAAEGAMDAANLLKPALARGEIRIVGATTIDEYRKNIEKDAALERRFQTVMVKEPSAKDAAKILRGLRANYESHHEVTLSDTVIDDAVYLADRYIKERYMPDKAIDVIDEASALVRVKRGVKPSKTREYTKEITLLNEKIEQAAQTEDFERAALYKMRLTRVEEKLAALQKKRSAGRSTPLTTEHLAAAVSHMTGIPVSKIQKNEAKLLMNLERHLSRSIIGQERAVTRVAQAVRRSRSGIGVARRPIGSFIFMGPTGVGKTELARTLAREVFGSDDALVKIDMSEFAEKHTTSRLVGAPAGYVGYEEGGQLTEKIRRQPYSVILFDEIEKAHRSVFNLLLQLLEDGTLTDGAGRSVDFSHTIIILTSNLGSEAMRRESSLGFGVQTAGDQKALAQLHKENAKDVRASLERFMRPELINRFDEVIVFEALTRPQIGKIFDLLIKDLQQRLVHRGIVLVMTPHAKRLLIDKGYDRHNGARPLRRAIEEHLEQLIAQRLIEDAYPPGTIVTVRAKHGALVLEESHE
jgi:ATP-dependent Clp protease ATP-binding subunit ClpC